MSEYKMMMDDDVEDGYKECDCCGYPAPLKLFENCGPPKGEGSSCLCEVCASTRIGNAYSYPSVHRDIAAIGPILGWVTNKILDEIRKIGGTK